MQLNLRLIFPLIRQLEVG